jgi:hypothetical protein
MDPEESRDALMMKLLKLIGERGELANSLDVAKELGETHDNIMGCINSMCAAELVVTEHM